MMDCCMRGFYSVLDPYHHHQTKTKKKIAAQTTKHMSCTAVSSFYLLIANLLLFAHVNAVLFR